MQRRIFIFLLAVLTITALGGCSLRTTTVSVGEEFTLLPQQAARVRGANLTLRLESVGHGWYANSGGEFAFANLSLRQGLSQEQFQLEVGESWPVNGYDIHLLAANPFGDNEISLQVTATQPAK